MVVDFKALANPSIQQLTPYQPGKPVEEVERELGIKNAIKLASNENFWGASPQAIIAAKTALQHSHIYPDGNCFLLKKALAEFLGVKVTQLTIGNGSENVLEMIAKAYLRPGDTAILSEYAFLTISLLIQASGAKVQVSRAHQYAHDVDAMLAAIVPTTRVLFIVNPNNPTGTMMCETDFVKLMQGVPERILVVVDEAYYEFMSLKEYPSTLDYLKKYPNLIITRTFSKAYGLAALRLGYAIASEPIADILNRARLPFNVNAIAAAAGQAALLDQSHIQHVRALTALGLQQLEQGLKSMRVDYIQSFGNFITFDVKDNAREVYFALLQKGIIVRPLAAYAMPTYLRVTTADVEQNEKFLRALYDVMS